MNIMKRARHPLVTGDKQLSDWVREKGSGEPPRADWALLLAGIDASPEFGAMPDPRAADQVEGCLGALIVVLAPSLEHLSREMAASGLDDVGEKLLSVAGSLMIPSSWRRVELEEMAAMRLEMEALKTCRGPLLSTEPAARSLLHALDLMLNTRVSLCYPYLALRSVLIALAIHAKKDPEAEIARFGLEMRELAQKAFRMAGERA